MVWLCDGLGSVLGKGGSRHHIFEGHDPTTSTPLLRPRGVSRGDEGEQQRPMKVVLGACIPVVDLARTESRHCWPRSARSTARPPSCSPSQSLELKVSSEDGRPYQWLVEKYPTVVVRRPGAGVDGKASHPHRGRLQHESTTFGAEQGGVLHG